MMSTSEILWRFLIQTSYIMVLILWAGAVALAVGILVKRYKTYRSW